MLNIEVGKKYLDNHGCEWEVIGQTHTPKETLYTVIAGGLMTWFPAGHFVSEVPSPATTTPSLVQCSCPTVVLMRDGCRCGNARKEIEQEFKQRGWG